ncbi:Larval cuticle protein LCP-17-like 3 [Homarus americanus]|uniref:Larval cuticle protein LCP-17-like 3 n=1 Tax=Homarus americanus TaxID=6706 RepID=A0A8J5MTF0_HOMAM|nr:Larval cuticle protein LCP-17-like 3 [Homarus americanus]
MVTWTSLVVLSLAVVSTLSFPRPDAEYNIPTVGLGARAQYYVLHSDGTFKYGYDTGDEIYEQAMAQVPGEITGSFGYKDPTGANIKLEYTADDRGFLPRGNHLPVAPEADFGSRLTAGSVSPTGSAPIAYAAPASAPAVPGNAAQFSTAPALYCRGRSPEDGSSPTGLSSSRAESADAKNSVRGEYAFVADDGINRQIKYSASADTGYIAQGDSLPRGPSVPGAESGVPTGRILPVLSEEEANRLASATFAVDPAVVSYSASGPTAGALRPTTHTGVSSSPSDASYSFSYDAGDSSRSESADPNLNVQGTYSFVPPDSNNRLTVNYVAGSDTGFLAEGDHLPVAPEADFGSRLTAGSVSPTGSAPIAYAAPASAPAVPGDAAQFSTAPALSAPVEVAQVRSSAAEDGSYSFSYGTASSSRAESADAKNSVRGEYAFVADDGINRQIKYSASADTGYIAQGDSLPRGPSVPGAESGVPTGRILPVLSEEEANRLASATFAVDPAVVSYSASEPTAGALRPTTHTGVSSSSSDASYSFSYDAGDSSRSESADPNLNVQGTYSFVPPDSNNRLTVNYVAGSDTGFLAEGDHLPVAPEADFGSRGSVSSPAVTYFVPSNNVGGSPAHSVPSVAAVKSAVTDADSQSTSGHTSHIVGDVLLHQYSANTGDKYGYVFTALRR